jgi:hypothetical protein
MIIERGDGEVFEFPGFQGPIGEFVLAIILEEGFEFGTGEAAFLQLRGGAGGREGLGVKTSASWQQSQGNDDPSELQVATTQEHRSGDCKSEYITSF